MIVSTLALKEIWAQQARWRQVYARRYYSRTGRWTRAIDRNIFDERYVAKFLVGTEAELEYNVATDHHRVYVIHDDGRHGEVHDRKPPLGDYSERLGVIIFPDTINWTAATGPDYFDQVYFTYRDWVGDDTSS